MFGPTHLLRNLAGALLVLAITAPASGQRPGDARLEEAQEAFRAGDVEAAVSLYREVLTDAPDDDETRFRLASVLASAGRWPEAAGEFTRVVAAAPENRLAHRGRATALLLAGRYGEARRALEEALTALPQDGQLAHTLARLLATAPVDDVRDGELALRLAQSVYEVVKLPQTAETLAMAHAEAGDFDRAVEIQRELIAGAERAREDTETLETLRRRLVSYLQQQAWRAVSPHEIAQATPPPGAAPRR